MYVVLDRNSAVFLNYYYYYSDGVRSSLVVKALGYKAVGSRPDEVKY
jgi:hypothetical protein